MPVYNFSAASEMPDDETPLRWYDTCSRAPPATFRTLGNSHWLSHATKGAIAYKYVLQRACTCSLSSQGT